MELLVRAPCSCPRLEIESSAHPGDVRWEHRAVIGHGADRGTKGMRGSEIFMSISNNIQMVDDFDKRGSRRESTDFVLPFSM